MGTGRTGGGSNGGAGSGDPGGTGGGGSGTMGEDSGSLTGGLGGGGLMGALLRIMPTIVLTTGGVTLAMAFLAFGKRRRDEGATAPDPALGSAAARGTGLIANSGLVPAMATPAVPAMGATEVATVRVPIVVMPRPGDIDAHLPRWRRPSLMEARKADPLRSVSTSVSLTFEGDAGVAETGLERRRIRYRMVSLLSDPDEVRGVQTGVLDEGDEVILLEKRGTYWRVVCPDGSEGWLHKMVLGDVVLETPGAAAGTWTSGDDGPTTGGFEDMLRAYTEKRNQFGEA